MYEQCFQLNSRPFTSTPFVKHYFATESIQQSLDSARLCVEHGSGPVIVVGAAGMGKSLFLSMLEDQYRSQFNVVNLACARLDDRQELLQNILFELQLDYRGMSEGELRLSLMDYLKPSESSPNGILLLVDEAHMLPTILLDEVRLITNCVRNGQPRVRLVMAGNQKLEDNLNDPKLESFNQRIASRCYLTRMTQDETANYITTHVDRAGGNGAEMFPAETLKKIHALSDGCPRFVNQICDQTMILAATKGHTVFQPTLVEEAWCDVQSLPSSSSDKTTTQLASQDNWTVIEFGSLDEDDAEVEASATELDVADQQHQEEPISESIEDSVPDREEAETSEFQSEFANESIPDVASSLEGESDVENDRIQDDQTEECLETVSESENGEGDEGDSSLEPFDNDQSVESDLATAGVDEECGGCENTCNSDQCETETDTEPVPASVSTTGYDDPFGDDFDDEEDIVDQYASEVAVRNKSSLDVTKEELGFITPVDENPPALSVCADEDETSTAHDHAADAETPAEAESQDEEAIGTTIEFEQRSKSEEDNLDPVAAIEMEVHPVDQAEQSNESDSETVDGAIGETDSQPEAVDETSIVSARHGTETDSDSDSAEKPPSTESSQTEDESIDVSVGAGSATEFDVDQVAPELTEPDAQNLDEIERQAEEILNSLSSQLRADAKGVPDSAEDQDKVVSHETESDEKTRENEEFVSSSEAVLNQLSSISESEIDDTKQERSEMILQRLLDKPIQEDEDNDSASSSADDKDMILVSRQDEEEQPKSDSEDSIPFPSTAVSTGQAKRMDYQQLFDQLRNISPDETAGT